MEIAVGGRLTAVLAVFRVSDRENALPSQWPFGERSKALTVC